MSRQEKIDFLYQYRKILIDMKNQEKTKQQPEKQKVLVLKRKFYNKDMKVS